MLSAVTLKIRSRSQSPYQFSFMTKCYIHAYFSSNLLRCSGEIEHNITFWSKFSVFLSAVTLKIRLRPQSANQFSFINKCYIHADFSSNLLSSSGDMVHNITFWPKFRVFLSAVTLKIKSRSQSSNQFSFINKCYIHAYFSSNLLSCSEDIEHNITFWSKFSVFLSAVTLKISSRSRSPNQGFSMSTCCMRANFGQNPVIRSGYIVLILMIHANISADADANGIRITVCASHSYLFRGVHVYALSYILFYICSTHSRKEDTKHIIFENTRLLFAQFRP